MLVFCDLVGSTELSGRLDPERFGLLIRRYSAEVRRTIESGYDGRIVGREGDGILAVFGVPRAHGDDAERAIRAALAVIDAVRALSSETMSDLGEPMAVRIAIHRGQVYLEGESDGVFGLAVNTAARLQTLAGPNEVVISDDVRRVVSDLFQLETRDPQHVKGIPDAISFCRVVGERSDRPRPRSAESPLVGRVIELRRIQDCWHAVRDGLTEGSVGVTLWGEAGIGKSRLVSTIAAEAAIDGARVIELAGSAFFVDVELYPVRRMLQWEAGLHADLDGPTGLARLSDELLLRGLDPIVLVPLLAPLVGIEPTAGYPAPEVEARKLAEQIGDAAYRYVSACLGSAPSLLIAEDLQWFDLASRALLSRVLQGPHRCALIMTARPGADPVVGNTDIELGPLSDVDSGELVDALATGVLLEPQDRVSLIARSDGIPLYIEELVANAQGGVSTPSDADDGSVPEAVPDLLYDLLVARLGPTANLIPVATAAAAIGRDVDLDLLAAAVDLPAEEFHRLLETLHSQGVLEPKQGEASQYRFRHELLREVAYELQPPSRRRLVHSRVGDMLIRSSADGRVIDWAMAASHLELAERVTEAVDAFEHAADAARMRGAFSEARKHLGRAIDLTGSDIPRDTPRDLHEVSLRLQRGYIAVSQEGNASPAAALDYERCAELAVDDPAGDEMFKAVIVLWSYHVIRGDLDQARRISEFTFRNLEKREWYRKFNLAAFGMLDTWAGDFRTAHGTLEAFNGSRVHSDEQRFQSEWFSPSEPVTAILMCVALVRFLTGDASGADVQFGTAKSHSERIGFPQGPFSTAQTLSFEAWTRIELEQFDLADALIARFTEISSEHGFDGWTMVAVTQHTVAAALRMLHSAHPDQDELRGHGEALHGMVELWKHLDTKFFLPFYLTTTGVLFAATGDKDTAHAHLTGSLQLARETGMRFYDVETMRHLARLELNPVGREERLRDALNLARQQGAALFEIRVTSDLHELCGDGASGDLRAALDRFDAGAPYPEVQRARHALGISE
jgi:class 3 adenylate cyclase